MRCRVQSIHFLLPRWFVKKCLNWYRVNENVGFLLLSVLLFWPPSPSPSPSPSPHSSLTANLFFVFSFCKLLCILLRVTLVLLTPAFLRLLTYSPNLGFLSPPPLVKNPPPSHPPSRGLSPLPYTDSQTHTVMYYLQSFVIVVRCSFFLLYLSIKIVGIFLRNIITLGRITARLRIGICFGLFVRWRRVGERVTWLHKKVGRSKCCNTQHRRNRDLVTYLSHRVVSREPWEL